MSLYDSRIVQLNATKYFISVAMLLTIFGSFYKSSFGNPGNDSQAVAARSTWHPLPQQSPFPHPPPLQLGGGGEEAEGVVVGAAGDLLLKGEGARRTEVGVVGWVGEVQLAAPGARH